MDERVQGASKTTYQLVLSALAEVLVFKPRAEPNRTVPQSWKLSVQRVHHQAKCSHNFVRALLLLAKGGLCNTRCAVTVQGTRSVICML